jgi:glycine/D-amino acid oxidase-like deaminating enzyme
MSFWLTDLELTARAPLPGDLDVDVVIAGAGYTGLWTAYYLTEADPSLRIAVLEAEFAGFGASGRNGGWCSALFPASLRRLAKRFGRAAAVAMYRAMESTVDEVGRVAAAEGIDCHYAKGGTVTLARTRAQLARARASVAEAREFGFTGPVLLPAEEARRRCGAAGVLGGTYTPHCATIQPGLLVRGLARVVEDRGVSVYERTRVAQLRPGAAVCPQGTVRAPVVVRATEAFSTALPGLRRSVAPVYSHMIATPPLPDAVWSAIGLAERETFGDFRHLVIYGQRTLDGRLAFGGRGTYHFGSGLRPGYDTDPGLAVRLAGMLGELFPALGEVEVAHAWGGAVAAPRDWTASVTFDRATGLGSAGGYLGDGVSTTNLAGRTLADLITGSSSELTRLPWVNHRGRRWEPEPLRWLGITSTLGAVRLADHLDGIRGWRRP